MTVHPENPLQLDFIVDTGDNHLQGETLKSEANKLIKYFMATLTVPDNEMWVNLSPYEKSRIIADGLSKTEMGGDMLAQDYILKQLTASLIYPESKLGKEFWSKVYTKAQEQFGTTQIPTNLFNKVWIVPQDATVYVHGNNIFVTHSHLKVMLEEDYLSLDKHTGISNQPANNKAHTLGSQVVREFVLPALEKEVNTGKNFSNLRQIYNSMILAAWYKKQLKNSLFGQIYLNRNKTNGIELKDKTIKNKIYQQYLQAYKKGVYNYIKEELDPVTQQSIPRKYFSGGLERVKNVSEAGLPDGWLRRQERREHVVVNTKIDLFGNRGIDSAMSGDESSTARRNFLKWTIGAVAIGTGVGIWKGISLIPKPKVVIITAQQLFEDTMRGKINNGKPVNDTARVMAAIALGTGRSDVKNFLEHIMGGPFVDDTARVMAGISLGVGRADVKKLLEGTMQGKINGGKSVDDTARVMAAIALGTGRIDVKEFLEHSMGGSLVDDTTRVMAGVALGIGRADVKKLLEDMMQGWIYGKPVDDRARVMAAIALGTERADVKKILEDMMQGWMYGKPVDDRARVMAAIALGTERVDVKKLLEDMMQGWMYGKPVDDTARVMAASGNTELKILGLDKAMLNTIVPSVLTAANQKVDKYGGIDFNANNMNLKEQGQEIKFSFKNLKNIQPDKVNAVLPVITNIQPMIDFQMFLGFKKGVSSSIN